MSHGPRTLVTGRDSTTEQQIHTFCGLFGASAADLMEHVKAIRDLHSEALAKPTMDQHAGRANQQMPKTLNPRPGKV